MARTLTPAALAEILAQAKTVAVFFEGAFASGTVRLWSGLGDLTWNGLTWSGAGDLGTVSPILETTDVQANGVRVTLSGIPAASLSLALQEARRGQTGTIWLAFLDDTGAVVADPYIAFSGRLDQPQIEDGGDTAAISIAYENRLIDLERPRERRFDHQDQQIDHPGDLGFAYVASIQQWNGVWGRG